VPQPTRILTPDLSHAHRFGAELRRWRVFRGLSQAEVGRQASYSGSQVGKVEKAQRLPTWSFVLRCDEVLDTGGALAELAPPLIGSRPEAEPDRCPVCGRGRQSPSDRSNECDLSKAGGRLCQADPSALTTHGWKDCPASVDLDWEDLRRLAALAGCVCRVQRRHYCNLELGHRADHAALLQSVRAGTSRMGWWVWWKHNRRLIDVVAQCDKAIGNPENTEVCFLPKEHPGDHRKPLASDKLSAPPPNVSGEN